MYACVLALCVGSVNRCSAPDKSKREVGGVRPNAEVCMSNALSNDPRPVNPIDGYCPLTVESNEPELTGFVPCRKAIMQLHVIVYTPYTVYNTIADLYLSKFSLRFVKLQLNAISIN